MELLSEIEHPKKKKRLLRLLGDEDQAIIIFALRLSGFRVRG